VPATAAIKEHLRKAYPNTLYKYPNGGFIMGYRDALLNILCGIKNYEDDQMGYTMLLARDVTQLKLDWKRELCAVMTYSVSVTLDESDVQEERQWHTTKDGEVNNAVPLLVNTITGSTPPVVHFSGGANMLYNMFAKAIYDQAKLVPESHIVERVKRITYSMPNYVT
jgi:hypothetical protein